MRYNILTPILVVALLSCGAVAHAQRPVSSYTPSRPTLSPYLYLTRQQNGPFPNYQTFVQPAQQQQQINRTQQANIDDIQMTQQNQQLQLQQGSQPTQQQQQAPQGMKIVPSSVAPTGVGASYNNLSHYYGSSSAQPQSASGGRNNSRGRSASGGSHSGGGGGSSSGGRHG